MNNDLYVFIVGLIVASIIRIGHILLIVFYDEELKRRIKEFVYLMKNLLKKIFQDL